VTVVAAAAAQTPVGQARPTLGPSVFTVFERAFAAHGVAADKHIAFINEAFFDPQVHVIHRRTQERLGSLPEPEGGFGTPLYIRLRNTQPNGPSGTRGEVVMLDTPPGLGVPAASYIHVFEYKYTPLTGFTAQLTETHALPFNTNPPDQPPNGIIFPSSFDFLPDGKIVVMDLFSMWLSHGSMEDWHMAWTSFDFGLEPYCSTVIAPNGQEVPGFYVSTRDANWQKVRLPYQLAVPFPVPVLPPFKGIAYIPLIDKVAMIRVQTPGGIFTVDRATLVNDSIPPFLKPYGVLVQPEIGLSDLSGDIACDTYHPDSEWLYWQRTASESGQNTCPGAHPNSEKFSPIYRVNVLTGEIQLVAESWLLYDFPTVLNVMAPLGRNDPFTYLVSSNVLEPRVAGLNALVSETHLVPPTIVPMVLVGAD
jgi:hypothetical protein